MQELLERSEPRRPFAVLDQATERACFESVAACEVARAKMVGDPDFAIVGECDVVPTTWVGGGR